MNNRSLKFLVACILLILMASMEDANAQIIEITPFAGYTLGGKAVLYEGDFRIDDALNYGGNIARLLVHHHIC